MKIKTLIKQLEGRDQEEEVLTIIMSRDLVSKSLPLYHWREMIRNEEQWNALAEIVLDTLQMSEPATEKAPMCYPEWFYVGAVYMKEVITDEGKHLSYQICANGCFRIEIDDEHFKSYTTSATEFLHRHGIHNDAQLALACKKSLDAGYPMERRYFELIVYEVKMKHGRQHLTELYTGEDRIDGGYDEILFAQIVDAAILKDKRGDA